MAQNCKCGDSSVRARVGVCVSEAQGYGTGVAVGVTPQHSRHRQLRRVSERKIVFVGLVAAKGEPSSKLDSALVREAVEGR